MHRNCHVQYFFFSFILYLLNNNNNNDAVLYAAIERKNKVIRRSFVASFFGRRTGTEKKKYQLKCLYKSSCLSPLNTPLRLFYHLFYYY